MGAQATLIRAGSPSFATIRTVRRPATAARARSRRGLLTALAACVTVIAAAGYWLATSTHDRRVNVLLITIDTLRADHVGSYGYAAAQTPSLDRLPARGPPFPPAATRAPPPPPAPSAPMTRAF